LASVRSSLALAMVSNMLSLNVSELSRDLTIFRAVLWSRIKAPGYLADYCVPVSEVPGRQHLRSARHYQLLVPRVRRGTLGTHAFSVAGPTVWNSLPDCLRDPAGNSEQFRRDLKTYLFAGHSRR